MLAHYSNRPTNKILKLVQKSCIRAISVSPAVPKSSTNNNTITSKKFKFSYENAKNKFINDSEINIPENKLNFNNYNIKSNKILIDDENAKLIPSIVALHARLKLPQNFKYSTLVKSLTCPSLENSSPNLNNQQLSIFGSHILSFYISEYLISNYPRLPISILKSSIDAYIGNYSLYDLAKNSWGISEDSTSKLDKYLSNEPELFKLGTLRYTRKVTLPESNVVKYSNNDSNSTNSLNNFELSKSEAYANSVRSIIAGLFIHSGESETKNFINNHILSRQVDISSLFSFKEAGKLLTRLLKTNNMEPPTVRLISETGRLSSTPIYVVGCFSGENLLATAEGNSLKEARIKSFGKALKAWYLYKPLDAKVPSDENFNGLFIDQGEKFY
jgi:dsRNA-specific ribonuclease